MRKAHGLVYTLFAIAMVSSVMLLLSLQSSYRPEAHVAEKIRSDEMAYLEGGIFSDLERGAHISGQRAIISVINSELASGIYNGTSNESIKDVMMTGTYNGTGVLLMDNATLANWTRATTLLAESLGYDANINVTGTRVAQKDGFGINITVLAEATLTDTRESMQLERSANISTAISVIELEDPFIAIESFGYGKQQIKKCNSTSGTGGTSGWLWGTAYINLAKLDYSDVPDKGKKILVVDSLAGRSNYGDFKAIVSESPNDEPPVPHINGTTGATAKVRSDSLVVKQDNILWLTNITNEPFNSCYFEAPSGPSFLDRLEGSSAPSQKYLVPGVNTGIGSFIYVPGLPPELQKGSDTYAVDYEYFA